MGLINCPECTREISDKAEKCIHCGYNLNATTIELTKKQYKRNILLSWVMLIVGLGLVFGSDAQTGLLMVVIGAAIWVYTKIQIWWHHK